MGVRHFLPRFFALLLDPLLHGCFTGSHVDRPNQFMISMGERKRNAITHLAAPNGLDLEPAVEGLGEARGEGATEFAEERGRSSSLRLPIWGVGGVELFASGGLTSAQPFLEWKVAHT